MKAVIPYFQVDAFTGDGFFGNPAGVCPLKTWLPDAVMQKIATEVGHSDTAFFVRDGDQYCLRWFSPVMEVELCGHATLAAAFILFKEIEPSRKSVTFETQSGPLQASAQGSRIMLDLPARTLVSKEPTSTLVDLLGRIPNEVWATDNGITMCVFENEELVRQLRPDLEALTQLGQYLLITAPGIKSDFVSRYFAPKAGVPEDPVTGSTHCILAPYWARALNRRSLLAHQVSARGGELKCEVSGSRVTISGNASLTFEGEVSVPEFSSQL